MAAGAAPELPALGEILAAAFLFIAWGVCLGVLWAYRRSLKRVIVGFANLIDVRILYHHPLGGVSSWLKAQAENIDHLLGEAALASERGAVVLFKLFLNLQVWIAFEIADLATDVWHALVHLEHRVSARLTKVVTHTVVKPLTRTVTIVRGVSATVSAQLNARVRALGARVARLEHALPHAISHPIPSLEALLRDRGRTRQRLHEIEKKLTGLGAVGLLTAALTRMGWRWIKCDSAKSVGRRLNCGSFRFLESLLSLAIDALVITNLCATTKLVTRVGQAFEPVLGQLTTGIVDLMKCQGSSRPPNLTINGAALPTLADSSLTL